MQRLMFAVVVLSACCLLPVADVSACPPLAISSAGSCHVQQAAVVQQAVVVPQAVQFQAVLTPTVAVQSFAVAQVAQPVCVQAACVQSSCAQRVQRAGLLGRLRGSRSLSIQRSVVR